MSKITFSDSSHGFQEGDWLNVPIEIFGVENYPEYNGKFVITKVDANTLTILRPGFFKSILIRIWFQLKRCRTSWYSSDWMPEVYYKQQEWDNWEHKALEVLK